MNTWSDLLSALRKENAYAGDGTLGDVKQFLTDNDIKVFGDLDGLLTAVRRARRSFASRPPPARNSR